MIRISFWDITGFPVTRTTLIPVLLSEEGQLTISFLYGSTNVNRVARNLKPTMEGFGCIGEVGDEEVVTVG
ncbi:hypothetical protein OGAPHI_006293 [Ogataea philodendri]|uniref:Uncharacterized protein n=1 Tax=Ogataea philodendri TaxID=1378263 RepID=A0A9P8NZK0_9ASCO|nr:uncharacterized protein OGAPHI_006293 [Ogataea philodendri]KAH3662112.1 hypothetical protein OGAPHI_006293 [Ogataea philodendri]